LLWDPASQQAGKEASSSNKPKQKFQFLDLLKASFASFSVVLAASISRPPALSTHP